mmetsp:Transcript_76683/g.183712  ORF Transcript_76683/g.183712 Transcript_76683/m.183712 type:complete len:206 (-) Transcript_76683:4690-5307(-)
MHFRQELVVFSGLVVPPVAHSGVPPFQSCFTHLHHVQKGQPVAVRERAKAPRQGSQLREGQIELPLDDVALIQALVSKGVEEVADLWYLARGQRVVHRVHPRRGVEEHGATHRRLRSPEFVHLILQATIFALKVRDFTGIAHGGVLEAPASVGFIHPMPQGIRQEPPHEHQHRFGAHRGLICAAQRWAWCTLGKVGGKPALRRWS